MTDAELIERLRSSANRVVNYAGDRIEQLTAERDRAYARGYSDAETEISKSALGQRNDFLHAQYSEAVHRIKDLNELLDEAQTEWSNYSSAWMTAEGKLADAEGFIEHLLKLLAEAASDLTAYVDAEYPPDTCDRYPDVARRHHRDMELVRRIEAALTGKEVMPSVPVNPANQSDIGPGDQGAVAGAAGHRSDCAIHNAPAYPAGPCDCGFSAGAAEDFETELIDSWIKRNDPDLMREDRDARSELDREDGHE